MNILFAPNNIASMPAITAEAMNKIPGVKARYVTTSQHKYLQDNTTMINLSFDFAATSFKKNPAKYIVFVILKILNKPYKFIKLCRWILWADVIHWSWDSTNKYDLDLKLIKLLKKKRFIEWVGSEMRIPEITMQQSKWYKEVFNNGYEYRALESKENSYRLQEKFYKYGFVPILVPEMHLFLKPGLFKTVHLTQYRIFQKNKFPNTYFPNINTDKITIVHSPSAMYAKGSKIIFAVIEKLKRNYNIEFILLHNIPRPVVLETMKQCDIFIDQIILGSYAAAAIEAMSVGKPVVAYIMPEVYNLGTPENCPVINANPDTLEEKLIQLINSPVQRHQIGIKSRQYVEEIHNADKISFQLLEIYNQK